MPEERPVEVAGPSAPASLASPPSPVNPVEADQFEIPLRRKKQNMCDTETEVNV